MKIGILGSGDVGRRLADGFIGLGHTVKIGSRDPHQEKITEWMAKRDKTKVSSGTFAEAASFTTLWAGTADAIKMADPKNFAGKVVIDVTNPLDFSKGMNVNNTHQRLSLPLYHDGLNVQQEYGPQ